MNLIKIDKSLCLRCATFLILTLPVTIIFSRFLADFTIVILALLFLVIKENNKIFQNKIIILSLLFILLSSISSISSDYPLLSLKSSFFHIRFILFSLSLSLIFISVKGEFLKKLFYIILVCYLILFFDATFQFIYKFNIFGYVVSPIDRVSSLFFDELVLGSYLVKLFPLIIFLYLYLNIRFKPIFIIYFIIHMYFTVFITGERVSFFILNIYYLIFGILIIKNNLLKISIFFLILLTFISTIFLSENINARTSLKNIGESFTNKNYSVCDETNENIKKNDKIFSQNFTLNCDPIFEILDKKIYYLVSVMHFNHYYTAYSIFKDNNFLGIGPKNFRKICKKDMYFYNQYSCSTHPHNYFIQLLSETGLFGFINFCIIYCIFLYLFFKTMIENKNKYRLCKLILLSSFLINFLPFLPSGSFFNNWVSILYSFPMGFLLGLYQVKVR